MESYLDTVELYQFEPVASDSSAVALLLALEPSPTPVHLGFSTASQPTHASPLPMTLLASQSPTRCSLSCRHLHRSPPSLLTPYLALAGSCHGHTAKQPNPRPAGRPTSRCTGAPAVHYAARCHSARSNSHVARPSITHPALSPRHPH